MDIASKKKKRKKDYQNTLFHAPAQEACIDGTGLESRDLRCWLRSDWIACKTRWRMPKLRWINSRTMCSRSQQSTATVALHMYIPLTRQNGPIAYIQSYMPLPLKSFPLHCSIHHQSCNSRQIRGDRHVNVLLMPWPDVMK